ncbi:MAG: imidazolonepropionase [Deltaproteobacteria bacterium]|nr:imidazolonepropionase [Deltaproteobacteria bacterium]
MAPADLLLEDIRLLLTMEPRLDRCGGELPAALGAIPGASLWVSEGRVAWAGPATEAPAELPATVRRGSAEGRIVLPGLVECHTHLVWGGDRERDFEDRCAGVSYEAILARGGGIYSTVAATRDADGEELFRAALGRMGTLLRRGVTTVEIKSGYGLDTASELHLLEVARRLAGAQPAMVVPTFLGAHVPGPGYRSAVGRYVDLVVEEMLPEVAARGLARFCDVFVEEGAFDVPRARRILQRAADLGLGRKVHAEQLGRCGGAALAAEMGATSADHLDHASPGDAAALAASGCVAVLLPGATFFLNRLPFPDGRMLRDAGCRVALSTDWNPGSSPTPDLFLMATFGAVRCGLTPAEALRGITVEAARALGLDDRGHLAPGARADLVELDAETWRTPVYRFGDDPVRRVRVGGEVVHG